MCVGSAFDAFIKSDLFEYLLGKNHKDAHLFERDKLFEEQVEPHNREFAFKAGLNCFIQYKQSGAYDNLLLELNDAIEEPKFELTLSAEVGGVPFYGKPDVYFINREGHPVIYDWKVNGYCSKYSPSPTQGWLRLSSKPGQHHKRCKPIRFKGIVINEGYLETFLGTLSDKKWADQLAVYGWLSGEEVGSEFIVGIDQLVCKNEDPVPTVRVAAHRSRVSCAYQKDLFERAKIMWEVVNSEHIFRDVSEEESKDRCSILDQTARARSNLYNDTSEEGLTFKRIMND